MYQYIIKIWSNLLLSFKISRLQLSLGKQPALGGWSVAVIKQWEADLGQSAQGAKKKTQYRKLRGWGQGWTEVSNVSFILLSFQTQKSSWGHTSNAVVHSYPQSKQKEWFKKKTNFISVLSIKRTVRDGIRMIGILTEIKTGTWNAAASYRVSGWESHSQCPWPAGCAQTVRIASRPESLPSSHLARSHPASHLHKSLAQL